KICQQNEFPPFVQKSFLASNTYLPTFYHFIKTHKTGPDSIIRPIVANINGPTRRISWLLANALEPILKNVSAHLKNSLELIRCIQAGDLTTNKALPYPCILDLVSLYTTIPYLRVSILAILFMDKLKTIALSSHLMISPYKRYVDYIYLQTSNEETADHFHHIINNVSLI
ncbi:unnamed protein product, partial [Porites lobata]